jgi:hypothetical protein
MRVARYQMSNVPLLLLTWALLLGPTAAGMTVALRALPLVNKRVFQAKKPWACDVCMGFWTVGLLSLTASAATRNWILVLSCGPAYPLALWVLRQITLPRGGFTLPELVTEDEGEG